ncbi:MAG: hypothetical protein LBU68_01920 [Rickettsiales bacterium]|jgi:hypothetical protein|nr:hypothetical protein [Rickettsiales bacterium]
MNINTTISPQILRTKKLQNLRKIFLMVGMLLIASKIDSVNAQTITVQLNKAANTCTKTSRYSSGASDDTGYCEYRNSCGATFYNGGTGYGDDGCSVALRACQASGTSCIPSGSSWYINASDVFAHANSYITIPPAPKVPTKIEIQTYAREVIPSPDATLNAMNGTNLAKKVIENLNYQQVYDVNRIFE